MREIRVATAQFENRDNDREYNLTRVRELTRQAVDQGAEIVSFHEGCIPGYTWVQPLSYEQLAVRGRVIPERSATGGLSGFCVPSGSPNVFSEAT